MRCVSRLRRLTRRCNMHRSQVARSPSHCNFVEQCAALCHVAFRGVLFRILLGSTSSAKEDSRPTTLLFFHLKSNRSPFCKYTDSQFIHALSHIYSSIIHLHTHTKTCRQTRSLSHTASPTCTYRAHTIIITSIRKRRERERERERERDRRESERNSQSHTQTQTHTHT